MNNLPPPQPTYAIEDLDDLAAFARDFIDDELPAEHRRALADLIVVISSGAMPSQRVYEAALAAHRAWLDRYRDNLRFTAYLVSEDLLETLGDADTVIIGANNATGAVYVNGVKAIGFTQAGSGIAALPANALRDHCTHDGLIVEAMRDGFALLTVDPDRDEIGKAVVFNDDGMPWKQK